MGAHGSSTPTPSAPSGAPVPGSNSAGPVSNGGGAAATTARDEPKPKPAYGKDMQILEVTNNGDPANMEMLIHLKVSIVRVFRAMCREIERRSREVRLCVRWPNQPICAQECCPRLSAVWLEVSGNPAPRTVILAGARTFLVSTSPQHERTDHCGFVRYWMLACCCRPRDLFTKRRRNFRGSSQSGVFFAASTQSPREAAEGWPAFLAYFLSQPAYQGTASSL